MSNSCTVHRPNGRYHILFEDLRLIAADDIVNASVLRVLEQKTDKRIELLREHYNIPEGQLPPDDLLWIDEEDASLRELERWSIGVRRKSSFARALKDRNPEKLPASLIQLGLVKRRWIARRNDRAWPLQVHADVQRDARGPFLIVAEGNGDYYVNGGRHNAVMEGYSDISRQFLYCFERVNRAIAALDGYAPPEPLPRWQKVASPKQQEAHRNNVSAASDTRENTLTTATQGGYSKMSTESHAFLDENTTNGLEPSTIPGSDSCPILDSTAQNWTPASKNAQPCPTAPESLSSFASTINKNPLSNGSNVTNPKKDPVFLVSQGLTLEKLRTAPRTVETWLGLLSTILEVPDPATCDPEVWERDWQKGVQRLLAATFSLSDALAWERVGVTAAYMTEDGSPSWWVQGRAKQTPVTARHVADNYLVQWKDCNAKQWRPSNFVAYDGPPLQYEAGYTGVTQATDESPAPIVEEAPSVAPPQGMKRRTAERLCDRIWQDYPALSLSLLPLSEERYAVSIQLGEDMWHDLTSSADWYQPTEATQTSLDQALHFATQRNAIPTEVGVIEAQPEPPPIVLADTQDDVPAPDDEESYVGMEEISADLQRGLRPLSSSPLVEELSVVAESLPMLPSKTGMSLVLATSLLEYLISAKQLNAELYPLAEDRAGLRIETASGWVIIEDAEAWRQYLLASAQSPPAGSVGAVIAMGGMGQAMEAAQ